MELRVNQRAGSERAHPTGVRALIVVENSLVVLRRADGYRASPIADDKKRDLRSPQMLFDHKPVASGAKSVIGHCCGDGRFSLFSIGCDDNTFARGQPVSLEDHWKSKFR